MAPAATGMIAGPPTNHENTGRAARLARVHTVESPADEKEPEYPRRSQRKEHGQDAQESADASSTDEAQEDGPVVSDHCNQTGSSSHPHAQVQLQSEPGREGRLADIDQTDRNDRPTGDVLVDHRSGRGATPVVAQVHAFEKAGCQVPGGDGPHQVGTDDQQRGLPSHSYST